MTTLLRNRARGVPQVTRADLDAGWAALGLRLGDHVVVHTALSSFGRVDGGPIALIHSLHDWVGPGGTLLMPTATWRSSYLRSPAGPLPDGVIPYDPATTPPDADMGSVPTALWRWAGAYRSGHPLMSVTALGSLAETLTAEHPIDDPLRPYRLIAAQGGRVLLLGVDHTRNTTVHAAEFLAELPHLTGPGYALIRDPRAPGGTRIERIAHEPDCSMGFERLNRRVPRRETQIGGALAWLLEGQELLDIVGALIAADPGALLCDNPACVTCTRGHRMYGSRRVGRR